MAIQQFIKIGIISFILRNIFLTTCKTIVSTNIINPRLLFCINFIKYFSYLQYKIEKRDPISMHNVPGLIKIISIQEITLTMYM